VLKRFSAVGMAAFLSGAALAWAEPAQDAGSIDLFLKLTEPSRPVQGDVVTRDDLRRPPLPPPPDKLSEHVHVTVGVGDPRCLPGEPDWIDQRPTPLRPPHRR
jgi:hypothetical protein